MKTKAARSQGGQVIGDGSEKLTEEINRLLTLDGAALRERWAALFGVNSSPRLGRQLMIRAIAYRLQERALGGLKPSTIRMLDRVADGRTEVDLQRARKRRASAGTVLIRQWRGVSHRVTVLDSEVVYRGRRYQSLSEVARAITGTRWSGPRFFGLRGRTKAAVNG
jgi:hypothetical protein